MTVITRARRFLLLAAITVVAAACAMHRPPALPSWITKHPTDASYNYLVGTGSGATTSEARDNAIEDAYQTLVRTGPRAYQSANIRQQFESDVRESLNARGSQSIQEGQRVSTEGSVEATIVGQAIPRLELVDVASRQCPECVNVTVYLLFRYARR